ncbi:MAG: ATP-binding protein [Elusimicrobiota bacterium]
MMGDVQGAASSGSGAGLERQTLEALKALGKALGQMALYKVGHPAVASTISMAHENLAAALSLSAKGDLTIGIDNDKLILNGRIVGTTSQLPSSLVTLFNRFKLTSLGFQAGLAPEELSAFLELAASRPDATAAVDPKEFLAQRGAAHVVFNEAVYRKAGDKGANPAVPGGAADAQPESELREIKEAIAEGSIERTIMALVEKAVPDPLLRQQVIRQVMALLEQDVAKRVDEVTTPLKKEKKVLQNEQVRTDRVLGSLVEGVVVVDDQGKILMMNPAAEQIYGASLAQSAGKAITEKESEQFVVTLAAELNTPSDRDVSLAVNTQGVAETQRTLRASSAIVKTEEGKVVGMVAGLPDAAKHRELQKIQRDFVAHVTHELRAPLSSIHAALEILQGLFLGKIEEEETRMLDTALKNSDRLAEMINSILDFSKIESGKMTVVVRPSDPAKIAREAVDSLQPWAKKKQISLALSAPEGLAMVAADSVRTVQVLINLLSNAIKFTPAGGQIGVSLSRKVENHVGYVEFAVTDNGPGIAKAEQARIFDKFVQIASGETRGSGTGLGLSIAKALVHLQNGKMWVDSDVGRGSTFRFTLPLHAAVSAEASAIRTKPPAPKAASWWKQFLGLK